MQQDDTEKDVAKRIKELRIKGHLAEAISTGENYLTGHGNAPRVLCSLASAYSQDGDFSKSDMYLERAHAIEPDNAVILTTLGKNAMAGKRYSKAKQYLDQSYAIDSDDPRTLNILVQHAMATKSYTEAEWYLDKTLAINPQDNIALNMMGQVAMDQRDYPKARRRLEHALSVHPGDTITLTMLAATTFELQEYAQAAKYIAEALDKAPTDKKALALQARIARKNGAVIHAVAENAGGNNEAVILRQLQTAITGRSHGQIMQCKDRLHSDDPGSEVAHLLAIKEALDVQDAGEALRLAQQRIASQPSVAVMRIGQLFAEEGVGGKKWQQDYDLLLQLGKQGEIFSEQEAQALTRHRTDTWSLEFPSVESLGQIDRIIEETIQARLAELTQDQFRQPLRANASPVRGPHSKSRERSAKADELARY